MATAISTAVLRQKATELVFVDESTAGTLSSAPSGTDSSSEQSFVLTDAPVWDKKSIAKATEKWFEYLS